MRESLEREYARKMSEDAAAWLGSLTRSQPAKATLPFEDDRERTDWAYFPRGHKGLPLHEMDISQQKLAHVLISNALSLPAYAQACAIMALESVLNLLEGRRGDALRDPGRYFVSLFGTPGDRRWGWRLEGHHVCLNFTLVDGEIASATPLFLGANPAAVQRGRSLVTRPCAAEEDAARELLAMLDPAQRAVAIISEVAPPDFVLTNMPVVPDVSEGGELLPPMQVVRGAWEAFAPYKRAVRFGIDQPRGLSVSAMTVPQQNVLSDLVEVYVDRLPEPLATLERERISSDVHFAWAGSTERRVGHYYRLQAAGFLVEYDNTQDEANHVHAVWRSPRRDFGMDALKRHVERAH